MTQSHGSVYLNAPARPSRRPLTPTVNKRRLQASNALVAIGMVGLSVALVAAGLLALVIDTQPTVDIVDAALDDPAVQTQVAAEIARGITDNLVGAELVEIAAAFELDVPAEADRLAPIVLADPAVEDEIHAIVAEIHAESIVDVDAVAAGTIDAGPLTDAAMTIIAAESPRLAAIVPPGATLGTVAFDGLPDLRSPASRLPLARTIGLATGLFLVIGAALHPRRHLVAQWMGRWCIGIGIVCAATAFGAPYLLASLSGYPVADAARPVTMRLLGPTALAAVIGMAFMAVAAVAQRREARILVQEGAAAALGYDEPPLWSASPDGQDLASRGLVDVNHPLTNI